MTLAALLIILLALPGFIFSLAYYNPDNIPLNGSLTHRTIASLGVTVVLHAGGLIVISLCGLSMKLGEILNLLNGGKENIAFSNISISIVVCYFAALYVIAYGLGFLFRRCVKKYNLERFKFFRIDNPWVYLFIGLNWKEDQSKPDGVKIAATIEIAGDSYLYMGVLEDFYFNKEGNLDRLVLGQASRRILQHDKGKAKEQERFYPINGHYFVLKYSEIKSLNIEYFNVSEDTGEMLIEYVAPNE
jgi:hypothetical protein